MYPPHLVAPMKADLTSVGFQDLETADDVDQFMKNQKGTALVVINSVCGCAAGTCRPGVKLSLQMSENKPDALRSVFAGVDTEATQRMRDYIPVVHFVERHHIEGRSADMIAGHLAAVYEEVCVAE
jgi:putative YphP/YqiW family bacilliredoxin